MGFNLVTAHNLLLWAVSIASAQFIPTPTDLKTAKGHANIPVRYKEVPNGICELDPSVKSYAGYADVAPDQHIFWWFFERRHNPLNAPLTAWFSGGPASSSMSELFQNHGPCRINKHHEPVKHLYSWTNASNMIFIDQPEQVGFSYTVPTPAWQANDIFGLPNATCPSYAAGNCGTFSYSSQNLTANSTDNAAPNVWKTLQGFMGAFPQYSANGFNIATSSYGGHYGPVFSEYIGSQNDALPPKAHHIDLQTLIIYNGWYDPLIQNEAYYWYAVDPGNTYDLELLDKSQAAKMHNNLWGPGNCIDQTKACYASRRNDVCSKADSFCGNHVEGLYDVISGRDETDIRELDPEPFPHSYYFEYLKQPHVLKAIGAFTNYSDYPTTTTHGFVNTGDDSRKVSTIEDIRKLISRNVSVLLFAGDADFSCNWMGIETVSKEIGAPGYAEAGYADLKTPDGVFHAQVRQADNFAFARVFQAGHEVTFFQPEASLVMFSRAIRRLDIATGLIKTAPKGGYRTKGPAKSKYREGSSTVQWHRLPKDATYNTTTNEPNPPHHGSRRRRLRRMYQF